MEKQRPLIGIIISEADYSFISGTLENMQKELFAADMDCAIFSTLLTRGEQEYVDAENNIFSIINYDILDGVILFKNSLNCESIKQHLIDEFKEKLGDKPVVVVEDNCDEYDSILYDNDASAELIASHLALEHGVKRIAYVSGPQSSAFHNRILDSFRRMFDKYGIELRDDDIHHGKDWIYDYAPIARSIVEKGLPDAVVCCSDFTAVEVLGELSKLGVNVPGDTMITGYSKDEPFVADYINVTSVKRNSKSMAVNAARYIISRIKGTGYEMDKTPAAELCPGITCGCTGLDYPSLTRSAVDSMIHSRRDGFDSYYNFMSEELIGAPDFESYLWKLNWYTLFLGDFSGFWICLNDNIMHSETSTSGYTERITIPIQRRREGATVDLNRSFSKSEMLPMIFEKRDKPAAFIFVSLHFCETNFGYTVLSYGDSGKVYDQTFGKWLRYVTCALEKQRRHIIYEDAVVKGQIRDGLTGLMNMRGFKSVMTERFARKAPTGRGYLRIISVDVSNLSGINTAYGYSEGDKVLQKLSVIMNNSCSGDDICVRVSGDEFLIAGTFDEENSVDDVPITFQRNLEAYNSSSENEYGIHVYSARVIAPFDSLEVLDTLPYEADYQRRLTKDNNNKALSRQRSSTEEEFDPEERRYVVKLLNDNLFTYNFQPIVNAHTGDIFAYEGLMRSGTEMRLSPVAILSHAEALGRLGDVERSTLTNLFRFVHDNRQRFENKMLFVNSIPLYTLPDKDFDELYAHYHDIMSNITIEFTEQTEASTAQLAQILDRSKRMGFKIAIDDYGTGYSNISNLLTFMPNFVKIDRSLITNVNEDKRKQHFCRNIIEYGHDNNFMVLAEGVETSEELRTVIEMGVDLIQGYYTGKPSEELPDAIDTYIAAEIIACNHSKKFNIVKKTFFTGTEKENTFMALDFSEYTDICINSPEYTLTGREDYSTELKIKIKDGIDCLLNLRDITLKNDITHDCIVIGENTNLTLNIDGYVTLQGSILVPESSSLKITGDGSLMFDVAYDHGYAIGTDSKHSFGDIGLYLNGSTYIRVDTDGGIAIGGGYNRKHSKIDIDCLDLSLDMTGKHLFGIGCINDPVELSLKNSKVNIRQQCHRGIGLGGVNQSAEVTIDNCRLNFEGMGDHLFGIKLPDAPGSRLTVDNTELKLLFKCKEVIAIGSENSEADIKLTNCKFDGLLEGSAAHALGNASGSGSLLLQDCTGKIKVSTGRGGAFPDDMSAVSIVGTNIEIE